MIISRSPIFVLGVMICIFGQSAVAQKQMIPEFVLNEETMEAVDPLIYENLENFPNDDRDQAVMYYAVDTPDPFMQLAVDYEVRTLIRSCNKDLAPNFVLIINSHLINPANGRVHLCRAGELSTLELPEKLKINYMLEKIMEDGFDPVVVYEEEESERNQLEKSLFMLPNGLEGPREYWHLYREYPLAYLGILRRIWSYVGNELFPESKYVLHAHIKSHGTNKLVLTGFHPDILKYKRNEQEATWFSLNEKRGAKGLRTYKLPVIPLGQAGLRNVSAEEEQILSEFGFGPVCEGDCRESIRRSEASRGMELNPDVFIHHLNHANGLGLLGHHIWKLHVDNGLQNLGITRNSISEKLNALDLSEKNYFGTSLSSIAFSSNLSELLGLGRDVFSSFDPGFPGKLRAGFLFIESCLTGQDRNAKFEDFLNSKKTNVGAYFAPLGTIWYRNIDWDIVFDQFRRKNLRQRDAIKYLADWARVVPNFVRLPEPVHTIENKCNVPVYLSYDRTLKSSSLAGGGFSEKLRRVHSGKWTIPVGYNGLIPFSSGDNLRLNAYSNTDTNMGAMIDGKLMNGEDPVCVQNTPYFAFDIPTHAGVEEEKKACTKAGGFNVGGVDIPSWNNKIEISACAAKVKICYSSKHFQAPDQLSVAFLRNDSTSKHTLASSGWWNVNRGNDAGSSCREFTDMGFGNFIYVTAPSKVPGGGYITWTDNRATEKFKFCVKNSKFTNLERPECQKFLDEGSKDPDVRLVEFFQIPRKEIDKNGNYEVHFTYN